MEDISNYGLTINPIQSFKEWYESAKKVEENADAMTLATSSKNGTPSARMLLFKGMIRDGFTLYTNYSSQKAKDILENPKASIVFYWHKSERQVRISGIIEKLSEEESQSYFHSRSRESQIASFISNQSEQIESKEALLEKFKKKQKQLQNQEVPYPKNWGGFLLKPQKIEFFIYGEHRLNDRILFSYINGLWTYKRLQP